MREIIKMIIIIIILFISTPAIAFDKWDKTDIILLSASTVALAIDWRQTRRIAEQPDRFFEINPILGRHPSLSQVDMYFMVSLIVNVGVAHILPSKWRKIFLGAMTMWEVGFVTHNNNIGLGISW